MFTRYWKMLPLLLIAGLALAACTTQSDDDDVAAGSDDSTVATTDDSIDDSVETDDDTLSTSDDESADVSRDDGEDDFPSNEDEVAELLGSEGFAMCSDEEAVAAVESLSPELDLASLEALSLDRTFVAEAYDNTYVGEVTDDLLIGISLDSRYPDQAEGVSVYLCDSEDVSVYLWGDIENGGATLSEDDVQVELTVSDDEITGTVALNGEDEQSFTATEAAGDSGMYVATDAAGEIDIEVRWVVASDGRQRGRIVCCWPTSHITFACGCCLQHQH
jgi:hypothetical protein